jgi:membrane protein DedA with SNARE-associated domain
LTPSQQSRKIDRVLSFVKAVFMALDFLSVEAIQAIAQQYGYWAIFGGILLENLGLPIPGETVTLVGGFLAGSGQLNYGIVWADAALGAAIGGNIGYWIGRTGGWALLTRLGSLLRIQEAQLVELRTQFSENAGKAIFFGRFIALLRIFASPMAGIAAVPFWKFFGYNLLGAAVWASVMVSLAFFAGKVVPIDKLISYASQFGIGVLLLIVAWFAVPLWLERRQAQATIVEPATPNEGESIND